MKTKAAGFGSLQDFAPVKPFSPLGGSSPESACVYFGPAKLRDLKRKAAELGMPFSVFVNKAVDEYLAALATAPREPTF